MEKKIFTQELLWGKNSYSLMINSKRAGSQDLRTKGPNDLGHMSIIIIIIPSQSHFTLYFSFPRRNNGEIRKFFRVNIYGVFRNSHVKLLPVQGC